MYLAKKKTTARPWKGTGVGAEGRLCEAEMMAAYWDHLFKKLSNDEERNGSWRGQQSKLKVFGEVWRQKKINVEWSRNWRF